ncbi:isocitrate lyase/phosphoenolpyruvate mutase family protein [Streptomyces sp. NPDC055103]
MTTHLWHRAYRAAWLNETLVRARAYAEAGADGVFVLGDLDARTAGALVDGSPLPVNLLAGPGALPVSALADVGVARVSAGSSPAEAAYGLVRRAARELLTQGTTGSLEGGIPGGRIRLRHAQRAAVGRPYALSVVVRSARAAEARGDSSVSVRVLHGQFSTERVLVMSPLEGTPLGKAVPDDERHGTELAETLLDQIMLDGVFHADPHPGNILLQPDGTAALLDFGSVGRIDARLREAMGGLFLAVDRGDPPALRDALLEITDRPEGVDEQRLLRALGRFSARHPGPGSAPDVDMFSDLFQLVADFRLAVPPEIAAVFRALATLEGTRSACPPASTCWTRPVRTPPPGSPTGWDRRVPATRPATN